MLLQSAAIVTQQMDVWVEKRDRKETDSLQRSVQYFGFLVGALYDTVNYLVWFPTYNMWRTKEKGRAETLPFKMFIKSEKLFCFFNQFQTLLNSDFAVGFVARCSKP